MATSRVRHADAYPTGATPSVPDTTPKPVPGTPPNVTEEAPPSAVPETVTTVPPATGPDTGDNPDTAGATAATAVRDSTTGTNAMTNNATTLAQIDRLTRFPFERATPSPSAAGHNAWRLTSRPTTRRRSQGHVPRDNQRLDQ